MSKLFFVDPIRAQPLDKQINNRNTVTDNDKGTFNADSAHDGLSTTISKGNDHDNKILLNTLLDSKNSINDKKLELFDGAADIPELGNLPELNTCYVLDVHDGATFIRCC